MALVGEMAGLRSRFGDERFVVREGNGLKSVLRGGIVAWAHWPERVGLKTIAHGPMGPCYEHWEPNKKRTGRVARSEL